MQDTWQRCLDAFLDSIYDHSGSSRSRTVYAYTLRTFFRDGRNPDAYSQTDVRIFIGASLATNYHHDMPIQAGTTNQRLMVLNSFYKFAATFEVDGAPLLSTKPPTYGLKYLKASSVSHALSAQEVERFFTAIDTSIPIGKRDFCLYLAYFYCARRRSELHALRWGELERTILIDADGSRRPGWTYKFRPKGRSRQVVVYEMPQIVVTHILAYLECTGRLATIKPEDPIFLPIRPGTGRKDGRRDMPMCGDYVNLRFKQICKRAGLDAKYSLHSLRHSSARIRYESGSDIRDIQQLLGHSNIGITDIYLRKLVGNSDPGAALLEKRFGHLGKL